MENKTAETLNAIERDKLAQLQILTNVIEADFSAKVIRREIAAQFMAAMLAYNNCGNYHDMAREAIDAAEILLQKLEQR